MINKSLFISYSQIAVFDPNLLNPFNDWTEQQVNLGFSWQDGSVSFKTSNENAEYSLAISISDNPLISTDDSIFKVEVPFQVPQHGIIEIASISDGFQIELEHGSYSLLFEELPSERIKLSFCKNMNKS